MKAISYLRHTKLIVEQKPNKVGGCIIVEYNVFELYNSLLGNDCM